MKKVLLFWAMILLFNPLSAQFYIGGSIGYGFGSTPRVNGQEIKVNDNVISTSNIYGSYGEGFSGGLKTGYFFNKHFGIELNLGYLDGAEQTKADVLIGIEGFPINDNTAVKTDAIAYAQIFRSTLSLVYQTDLGIYGRFGLYIPLGGKTTVKVNDVRIIGNEIPGIGEVPFQIVTSYKQEIHGEPTVGFASALGYYYAFENGWKLFAELEYMGLAIKSKDAEYTNYYQEIDTHQVGSFPGFPIITTLEDLGEGKNTKFVNTVKSTDNYAGNPNFNPREEVIDFKQSAPYDSIGINVGVVYKFN